MEYSPIFKSIVQLEIFTWLSVSFFSPHIKFNYSVLITAFLATEKTVSGLCKGFHIARMSVTSMRLFVE